MVIVHRYDGNIGGSGRTLAGPEIRHNLSQVQVQIHQYRVHQREVNFDLPNCKHDRCLFCGCSPPLVGSACVRVGCGVVMFRSLHLVEGNTKDRVLFL